MSTETEIQLKHCLDLMAKIRKEYPNGEFDREMIHGDMDFRFKQIKEILYRLETFPAVVHEFARFVDALHVPEETIKTIFKFMLKEPHRFPKLKGLLSRKDEKDVIHDPSLKSRFKGTNTSWERI